MSEIISNQELIFSNMLEIQALIKILTKKGITTEDEILAENNIFGWLNSLLSAIVWLVITYLFDFSVIGWIVGLVSSFIYHELIGPFLIVFIGDKFFNKN